LTYGENPPESETWKIVLFNTSDLVKTLNKENPHFEIVQYTSPEAIITVENTAEALDEKYPPTQGKDKKLKKCIFSKLKYLCVRN